MNKNKLTIVINGKAGQGSLWLGKQMAAVFLRNYPKKYVSFLPEYQSGVRAGNSKVQLICSSFKIDSPFVEGKPDIEINLANKEIIYGKKVKALADDSRVNEQALNWFRQNLSNLMVKF